MSDKSEKPKGDLAGAEKRTHARVEVATEVRLSGPLGVDTGLLKDLSKGGASALLPTAVGKMGDIIEAFLELPGGFDLGVMAEIMRLDRSDEGFFYGLRFNLVEPAMQQKLTELIEGLLKTTQGSARRHTRLTKRLPVKYKSKDDLRATLQNISVSGLSLYVREPMVLQQDIEITIPDPSQPQFGLLILRGQVKYQYPAEELGSGFYRVGVEFSKLTPVAKRCIEELLKYMMDLETK